MYDNIFISLLSNVALLVLVAAALTKIPVVRRMLVDGNHSLGNQAALALIFGLISIFSTYTGIRTQGAIVNTRVIGVLAAGLLAGPKVGMAAAVIAGTHRYLFDIGGFTAFSCAVSTLLEGLIGAYFGRYFQKNNYDNIGIFLITVAAEICQMIVILILSKPFSEALALVKVISAPMITLNAVGMVFFINTFRVVFLEENNEYAHKMQLALRLADQSLPHLRKGLYSKEDMDATASILFDSLTCTGVYITDLENVIARKVHEKSINLIENGMEDYLDFILSSISRGKEICGYDGENEMFPIPKGYILIAAPLTEMKHPIGSLIIVSKKQWNGSHIGCVFVTELAKLFSTQLELGNMEYQKRMLRKAEFRTLQSQVNPHFLYNALNTISYVCRENPDRARELLLSLSTYYRQTLENDRLVLSLHTELYQINHYLELEKARFEEKLQIDIRMPDDIDCMVPAFILQPLVENAVRYGADSQGARSVTISIESEETGIRICVSDHGGGIPSDIIHLMDSDQRPTKHFGLFNVHKRLKSIYGERYGLTISNTDQGANVSFLIPHEKTHDFAEFTTLKEDLS